VHDQPTASPGQHLILPIPLTERPLVYQQSNARPPFEYPPQQPPGPAPGPYQVQGAPPHQPYPYGGQGFPPVPPPATRKRRGGVVALVVVLVLLVVGGGAGAWWFMARPGGDGRSPLSDELIIEDFESGISYTMPEAWEEMDSDDLIEAFTSSASVAGDAEGTGASVVAFSGEAMTDEEMSMSTSTIAGENSEYFYPYPEDKQILISEPIEVDGQKAYRFTWEVSISGEPPMYGHIIHIIEGDRSVFLMGMVYGDDPAMRSEVDAVVSSVSLL
jgi:hypothetical protein